MRNYSGAIVDLVVFALGVVNDDIENWKKTTCDDNISVAAYVFIEAIGSGTEEDLTDALQQLIFAIFSQKRSGTSEKYDSLVYSFAILYSYCKEGYLNRCNMFTQYFSRIIWYGRVSIRNVITEEAEEEELGFFE